MPEDIAIDGSNLEGNQVEAPQTEAVQTQTEQPVQTEQPPQSNIPDQYKSYTPEQWFKELNDKNSMLGRYRQEVDGLRQKTQQPVYQQQYPTIPSSLPGQEALGQRQPQVDLNEEFFNKPIDAVRQVVAQEVRQGIQTYEQQQATRQQQAMYNRQVEIKRIDDDELMNLRLDESVNFTPEHEALMEALAKRDKDAMSLINKPDLTEAEIRNYVRSTYAKADKILSGDTERLKAFTVAQKQAAVNGAPSSRAGTVGSKQEEVPAGLKNYSFLLES